MTDRSGRVSLVDVTTAAMDMLGEVESGQLNPAFIEARTVEVCRELVGQVDGPGDDLWPVQCDVARQVIAAGGFTAAELAEWTAVARRREAS